MSRSRARNHLVVALGSTRAPASATLPSCGGTRPTTAAPTAASRSTATLAWREADEEAFGEAAREGRLVLLSLQADWCHWCHVMNDTTYRDASVVARVEERFVPVRAEADARPDLAERYGLWGWPATILLTADGREIAAVRGYRDASAFLAILDRALAEPRPIDIFATPDASSSPPFAALEPAVAAARAQLDATYDEAQEGWGQGQKYPFTAPVLDALLRTGPWPSRAERSLERYTRLIDPIWGGVYQYSERGDWEHPHFERIAHIQAGMLEAIAEMHRRTGDSAWATPGHEIVRFVEAFLATPEGGMRASMDADLRVPGKPFGPGGAYFAQADAAGRALGLPRVDPAVYASTNGLVAAGLARFAASLPRDEPRRASVLMLAERAVAFSMTHHLDATSGLYAHSEGDTAQLHLADQVAMLRALLALQHATGDGQRAARARTLADAIERTFCSPDAGCRSLARTSDATTEGTASSPRLAALHAPRVSLEENGRLAQCLAAVADLSTDRGYEERARDYLVAAATPQAIRLQGRIVGDFLLGATLVTSPRAVAHVIGPREDPRTLSLFDAALAASDLRMQVELAAPGEGRYPYPDEPAMFACSLDSCAAPVTDPAQVARALRTLSE